MSISITLRRDARPLFPARCVHSGEPNPDNHVSVWTHTLGWWTWALFSFGSWVRVRPPVHSRHKLAFLIQTYGRAVLSTVLIVIVAFVVYPLIEDIGPLRKYVFGGLVCLAILPYCIWETLVPPVFDIVAYKDRIHYNFKNREYTDEFAELNVENLIERE